MLPNLNDTGHGASLAARSTLRWIVLALSSAVLFGVCILLKPLKSRHLTSKPLQNYFAYDIPAALTPALRTYLVGSGGKSPPDFEYHLNLFYSSYSLPNVFLPFIGGTVLSSFDITFSITIAPLDILITGYLMDLLGTRKLILVLSCLVFGGQVIFAMGIQSKAYWMMHVGRVVFGLGGETLSVAV